MTDTINCMECGIALEISREDRPYGDGLNVIIKDQEVRRCPDCGEEEVVYPVVEKLHKLIAQALVRKRGQFTPAEIRFLRTYLGLSSRDFANVMAVTPESVSRWERSDKRFKMKRSNDRALRFLVLAGNRVQSYRLVDTGQTTHTEQPLLLDLTGGTWEVAAVNC